MELDKQRQRCSQLDTLLGFGFILNFVSFAEEKTRQVWNCITDLCVFGYKGERIKSAKNVIMLNLNGPYCSQLLA